jgi:hypothetical protein
MPDRNPTPDLFILRAYKNVIFLHQMAQNLGMSPSQASYLISSIGIPESIEWFIEDQAFSPSYDLAPLQPLSAF